LIASVRDWQTISSEERKQTFERRRPSAQREHRAVPNLKVPLNLVAWAVQLFAIQIHLSFHQGQTLSEPPKTATYIYQLGEMTQKFVRYRASAEMLAA
jgi:hypothetical protein